MLYNQLQSSSSVRKEVHGSMFPWEAFVRCVSWNTRGLLLSAAFSQVSWEQKHKYFKRLTDQNDVICLQETHGKHEFLRALQVLHTPFRMFGTFVTDNVDACGIGHLHPHTRDHLPRA